MISHPSRTFKENLYFSVLCIHQRADPGHLPYDHSFLYQVGMFNEGDGTSYVLDIDLGFSDIRVNSVKLFIRNIDGTLPSEHPYSPDNEENILTGGLVPP